MLIFGLKQLIYIKTLTKKSRLDICIKIKLLDIYHSVALLKLKTGFFNSRINFQQARLDILRIHSRKMNLTRGINLRKIAEQMSGSSGAEVKGTCTEAGMYALRERRVHVTQEDFQMAVAKVSSCCYGGFK